MKIDATTYQKLPEHLKALFQQAPNPSREEVVAGFPVTGPSSGAQRVNRASESIGTFGTSDRVTAGVADAGGSAARFFYCAKASKRDRGEGNTHPTVKPTDLMAYLCRLVTPPGGTVLDPFMGSGSTGKAAMREGFRFIGIEREAQYMDIARARIHGAVPVACDLFSAPNKPSREAA